MPRPFGGPPPGMRMGRKPDMPGMRPKRVDEEFDLRRLEEQSEKMMEMTFLDSKNCEFYQCSMGFLNLKMDGKDYKRIQIIRTFPYSAPFSYLSVRGEEGLTEIGIIKELSDFNDEAIELIKRQLEFRYFTPVIKEILYARMRAGVVTMKVMTDFGECRFSFRTNNNAVTKLSDTRILIQDMDNNRYEIPDTTKLSMKAQKKLDVLL